LKSHHFILLTALLSACQSAPPAKPALTATASAHQALAQASCGGCHSVGRYGTSPNASAPPFPVIVNQEGLTAATLSHWLRGAHNYPAEMDFHLDERKADTLVSYMMTLRDPNYRRPAD
jgi:mono/diheme cytochrome c family protein